MTVDLSWLAGGGGGGVGQTFQTIDGTALSGFTIPGFVALTFNPLSGVRITTTGRMISLEVTIFCTGTDPAAITSLSINIPPLPNADMAGMVGYAPTGILELTDSNVPGQVGVLTTVGFQQIQVQYSAASGTSNFAIRGSMPPYKF